MKKVIKPVVSEDTKPYNKGLKLWDRIKLKLNPSKTFVVTMMYSNGTIQTFVVKAKTETFEHNKRMYYLYYENSWTDLTLKKTHLFYWDDNPTPINRVVRKEGDQKFFSVSPENIKPLLQMEYVKVLTQGEELNKFLKTVIALSIGTLITVGLIGLYIYQKFQ